MKKICFLNVLLLFIFYNTPAFAFTDSREEYEKTGHVLWDVDTKEKLVALTFDDGPHPIFTPQILDILAKYDAKATFFIAGNKAIRFPAILKQEAIAGHEIANHTFHHLYHTSTAETLAAELEKTDKVIQQITGVKPSLYRPVGGIYNDLIIHTAIKNKKEVVLWSWNQDPRDWTNPPASQISAYITKGVKPGNIILFHDWYGSEYTQSFQTVHALDNILAFLSENGYKCVTVSEMLYRSTQMIPDSFGVYPAKKTNAARVDLVY